MGATLSYRLVQLANGAWSIRSLSEDETFHPVIGPAAEAQALYARQLRFPERVRAHRGEFIVWDVGLGAAANALTVLQAAAHLDCSIRVVSFDRTLEPLRFGLQHAAQLGYFGRYEQHLHELLKTRSVCFHHQQQRIAWELIVADFPEALAGRQLEALPKPHAILYDAYSPAKNPAMWTGPLFCRLYQLLDPARPCALATYSRSTMLRVTLLTAGFFVGRGDATGEKEETTVAANCPELIRTPLDARWLQRAHRSTSGEPLSGPVYRQRHITSQTWRQLQHHPQFRTA